MLILNGIAVAIIARSCAIFWIIKSIINLAINSTQVNLEVSKGHARLGVL